jgi:uncharacterized protein YcbK (DUF882 family)
LFRRGLLRGLAVVLPALAPLFPSPLAWAAEARALSFHHTHTGEKLTVRYWEDGHYLPEALEQVNRFLRDHRSGQAQDIDPALLDLLNELYVASGSSGTFEVISCFRSPDTNATLRERSGGVAKKSLHMKGKAIDIRLTDVPTQRLRDLARDLERGGVGYYRASDFVHVDTGRVRIWGD